MERIYLQLEILRVLINQVNPSQIFKRMKYIQIFYEETPKARIFIRMIACNGCIYMYIQRIYVYL